MTPDYARTIGDDYADYTDDELGYNYHASEVISASEANRLQQIKLLRSKKLNALEKRLDDPSDLQRWALARRRLADGDRPAYFKHVNAVVDSPMDHPALHYPEIFVDLARQHALDDDLDAALDVAARIEEHWPELSEAIPLLNAQLLLCTGRPDDAHEAFEDALTELDGDDVDLLIETAEDFIRYDAFEHARVWLDHAEETAHDIGDDASIVDIKLLRAEISE